MFPSRKMNIRRIHQPPSCAATRRRLTSLGNSRLFLGWKGSVVITLVAPNGQFSVLRQPDCLLIRFGLKASRVAAVWAFLKHARIVTPLGCFCKPPIHSLRAPPHVARWE